MIEPTRSDVGRRVTYHPLCGMVEEGTITSFNDSFVFVRYGAETQSKATDRRALSWAYEIEESPP